jgi:hypothetical protein
LILTFGILARYSVLRAPNSRAYLVYYASESTLLIIFANLPFLASLVVSTAPARLREFGRNISFSRDGVGLPLPTWPRSRRMSVQSIVAPPPTRASGMESTTTFMSGIIDRKEWTVSAPVTRPASVKCSVENLERRSSVNWPLP